MGYKSKKPKGLKIKKTDTPSYYGNREEDDTLWNDEQVINYFGKRGKRKDWPVWTSQYGYGRILSDYEKYNSAPTTLGFNPMMNEHQGYKILNYLYKRGNFRSGRERFM